MQKTTFLFLYLIYFFPAGIRDADNIAADQKKTLLKILISKTHRYYYYENELEADASNFKTTTYRGIIDWTEMQKREKGNDNVVFILKMQEKDSLNTSSKKLLAYIKEQKKYEISPLNEVEKHLIRVTELDDAE